ncbi:spermidine synthase [Arcanobacterium pluranimalium]|uniref:spermidine synthase n=1 Tax=Arcanobacterium pluranimalium TaxID=108028 RepID=UPI001EF754FD|nr:fused MFS/spermidine synthase [Arcanobacterium pluranimalium]MBM7825607.1 spermidine synthase [Arcanobacterium pluranimalium]
MAQRNQQIFPQSIQTEMSNLEVRSQPGNPDLLTLWVDGVESSAIKLSDAHFLEFEYMEHIRIAIDSMYAQCAPLKVLHLGGGGCALARALHADRPKSRQLAIEIDPQLAEFARLWFDLPRSPSLRIRSQDARITLDTNQGRWDVIIRDAFSQGQVPDPLRTVEAHQRAQSMLGDDGLYCLNIAGSKGLAQFFEEVQAVAQSFKHLAAISDPAIFKNRRFGNIVLLASNREIDTDEISRQVRKLPLPTSVITEAVLDRGAQSAKALTDADIGWLPSPRSGTANNTSSSDLSGE